MRLPSGDHTGPELNRPFVRRVLTSRANSKTHKSVVLVAVKFAAATRLPSRDRLTSKYCPGVQAIPVAFPCRSYQVSLRSGEPPAAYTSVPVSDTEYPPKAPTRSAM